MNKKDLRGRKIVKHLFLLFNDADAYAKSSVTSKKSPKSIKVAQK